MPGLLLVSVVPLFAAFLLGAVDGVYFHLRRYRLFAFPESRAEHVLHTARAFLALPPMALLYLADAAGLCLWTAAAAIAVSGAIGVYHADDERGSFEGLTACTSRARGANTADLLKEIMKVPLVRCDQVQFSFLGISMAGWNAIISLTGAALIAMLLLKGRRA